MGSVQQTVASILVFKFVGHIITKPQNSQVGMFFFLDHNSCSFEWRELNYTGFQQTRELISAQKMSYKHNKDLSCLHPLVEFMYIHLSSAN